MGNTLNGLKREPVALDAKNVTLGNEYTDTVSGIKGVATIVYIHLTGCDQVALSYVSEGKQEYIVVDATRLEELTQADAPRRGAGPSTLPSRLP